MTQPELFDTARLVPQECPVCGATRPVDATRAEACTVDRDRAIGIHAGRPVRCLNFPKPEHERIPF